MRHIRRDIARLIDVVSLYTNIPHEDGIEAYREAWNTRETMDPPDKSLVDLLTLVLKCNIFEFNGDHYLQVQGTTMGTKMALSYANIFMGYLTKTAAHVSSSKAAYVAALYWRHWHTMAPWSQRSTWILRQVYAFHKTITFTREISNENHVFLDTKFRIEGSQLVKDLYLKTTDIHQYLLQTSCHPRHCCKNIPYSLALRIRRICSQEADYERRTHQLSSHLCRRGYKSEYVDKAITKASSIQRHELQNKHWQIIETNTKLNCIFFEKPMI